MALVNVTLATLRTRLFERVDTASNWTNAEARLWLNHCLHFWNLLTGRWRQTLTLTIQPGGTPYTAIGGTLIWPMRMELASGVLVEKTSVAALDLAQPSWETETTGSGGSVPATLTYWAPRSTQLFAIWPRVTVATAVRLDGIANTPTLTADGDFIDLTEGLESVLLDYAAHLLRWKYGGPKFFNTLGAYKAFILAAAEENAQIKATSLYRWAAGVDQDRLLRPRRRVEAAEQTLAGRVAG